MATLRTTTPSVNSIFRFASAPAASRRCTHCLKAQRCPFSSYRPARAAQNNTGKRPLTTDTSYRPYTLQTDMPPPRNSGTPDTSITEVDQQVWPPSTPWQSKDKEQTQTANKSVREGEAQKSEETPQQHSQPASSVAPPQPSPSTQQAAPSQQQTAAPKKKSKLRPRKAPISLTPKAVTQLRDLFESPQSQLIRIGVKNRGCSGLAYHLEYVDKAGSFDESVEQDGVKVLIDSKALFSIIGSEMDWIEDKLSARFVFRNPNITEQCGCGESFSIS
ncbi:hypothetical protein MBLNU230_g1024t1 [Neophaeotheca triangularis]